MSEAIANANANAQDIRSQVSAEEWAVRQDLAAAYRMVAHYGWDDLVFTHLSARVPGPEMHFLLNPFGFRFDEVTASNLVKIDLDGKVVLDTGYGVNAAGFTIHSAIHMGRDDAHAVMHLHTDDGIAVSSTKEGFLPLNQHALTVYHDVAYHDWEGIALDLDERERLVADIGDHHLLMLRNHGTLAVGGSVASCFMRLYYFERACSIQTKAAAAGTLQLPSGESIDKMKTMMASPLAFEGLSATAWPAIRRQADRLDPGYAN